MKKILILLGICMSLLVTGVLFYFKPNSNITNNRTSYTNTIPKNEAIAVSATANSYVQNNQPSSSPKNPISTKAVRINAIDAEKLVTMVGSSENGVKYMSIEESGLPPDEISNLKKDYDNLNKYGSYSGGEITHEFTKANDFKEALRKNGNLENVKNKLNFTPTDVNSILGGNFKLMGADYSGSLSEGKFNSLFRYYEDGTGKRFEINEMYLTPANNYSLNVYKESINFDLVGHPATLQSLKNAENKEIYNLDFNVNRRVFSISSEGFNYSDFLQTSMAIAHAAEKEV